MDFRKLTYNEIIFRVLLQREEATQSLKYSELENALPKQIRKAVEQDWNSYIRNEDLDFYSAFQKAVRKHIPGVYYVVMAMEFFGKIPFHKALSSLLQKGEFDWQKIGTTEDEIFELAERLLNGIRHRYRKPTPHYTSRKIFAPPPPDYFRVPKRRCPFCKQQIPLREFSAHIDDHINPPHLERLQTAGEMVVEKPQVEPKPFSEELLERTKDPEFEKQFERFSKNKCIGCGNPAILGDFYCFGCAPD